ncbi:hypothetical protein B0H10DRAFT_2218669 [Mycena sp. CBHHK59/15]|nr:hypothetical protein B0H10DRAFT_2218669 [Mycena sp. CBHHK59/15]
MSQSTLGCAQKPNSTLLNASEIQWFNNVDDNHLISGSATASSSCPLAPIFTRAKPVGQIAGSHRPSPRRSSRSTQPSACITDPNNIEAPTVSVKHKSQATLSTPRKAAHIAEESDAQLSDGDSDSDSDVASVALSVGGDTEHEGEEPLVAMEVDSEEYKYIKAMADADHAHAMAKIAREDPTADIRTVFHRVKGHKDPTTGVLEDGTICMVCTRKGCKASLCWLMGSVTTLCKHIACHWDHFDLYEARCQQLRIPLNERAIPQNISPKGSRTLDGVVIQEARAPPFMPGGLHDFITEIIVTQDEAISLVEKASFVRMLKYLRPGLKDSDILSCNTIHTHIMDLAEQVEAKLKDTLKASEHGNTDAPERLRIFLQATLQVLLRTEHDTITETKLVCNSSPQAQPYHMPPRSYMHHGPPLEAQPQPGPRTHPGLCGGALLMDPGHYQQGSMGTAVFNYCVGYGCVGYGSQPPVHANTNGVPNWGHMLPVVEHPHNNSLLPARHPHRRTTTPCPPCSSSACAGVPGEHAADVQASMPLQVQGQVRYTLSNDRLHPGGAVSAVGGLGGCNASMPPVVWAPGTKLL